MTRDQFRTVARREIEAGASYYGQRFIDHRDGTVYDVTRWANAPDIACDEYWRPTDRGYPEAYRRAVLDPSTWHYPRAAAPEPE